jgi:hypothetical protein
MTARALFRLIVEGIACVAFFSVFICWLNVLQALS